MKKATKDELEAAAKLDAALALEEEAALTGNASPTVDPVAPTVAGNEPAEQITTPGGEAPRRKPGRPKASDAEKALRESVGAAPSGDGAAPGGAKRGPKPKVKTVSDPAVLARSLVGIHQLGAMLLQVPELQISEEEGKGLADAVTAVCEEYGLAIDGKTGAAMQLFGAAAMIYGPRYFHFKMRIATQRAQAEQGNGQTPNH